MWGVFLCYDRAMFNCNFPLRFLSVYEVLRPSVIVDTERETESLDYSNVTGHTLNAFLHETGDAIIAEGGHLAEEEKRAVFTAPYDADICRHDLIVNGGDVWLVDEEPNRERNPFTDWAPTVEVRCVAWRG